MERKRVNMFIAALLCALLIPEAVPASKGSSWVGRYEMVDMDPRTTGLMWKDGSPWPFFSFNEDGTFEADYKGETIEGTYGVKGLALTMVATVVNDEPLESGQGVTWETMFRKDYGRFLITSVPFERGESDEDAVRCFQLEGDEEKSECYVGQCAALAEEAERDRCLANIGSILLQPAACENILSAALRDGCYLEVAIKAGDPDVCDSLTDSTLQEECLEKAR